MTKKAFTLIELLVVIAIIGLLASIVLVSMKGSRDKAKLAKVLEFSQSVQSALGAEAVGIWRFDEGSGTTASDSSGYGNNGTLVGPAWTANTPSGKGNALSFDGNDYVDSGTKVGSKYKNEFTVVGWININSGAGGMQGFVSNGASPFAGFYIRSRDIGASSKIKLVVGNGGATRSLNEFNYSLTQGVWHHLAFVVDGTNKILYVDGVQRDSIALGISGPFTVTDSQPFRIGTGYGGTEYLNGLIDEVGIYSQALSSAQIQKHYAEGLKRRRNLAVK